MSGTGNPFDLLPVTQVMGAAKGPGTSATVNPDADAVGIIIGKQSLYGWEEVEITRGIERVPSSFMIRLTERYPTQPTEIAITPGDPCKVTIGADMVLTGYVDRYEAEFGDERHVVTVSGRSLMQDFVDCSAKITNYEARSITLYNLAVRLAAPFGIRVSCPDGDSAIIPTFNVTLPETPWEIVEHIARWAQRVIYDDTQGNIVIATVGDSKMASGFTQGANVQSASVSYSMDQRYTEIDPVFTSTQFLLDPPPPLGSPLPVLPYIPDSQAIDNSFPARADGKPRYRPLVVVSSQTQNSANLAAQYAAWEMGRRYGRSQQVRIVCDSWRDSSGTLWTPNALAVLNLPTLKLENQTWLISEVTFKKNGAAGTTANLVLMPKEAFIPQKEILVPYDWQVGTKPNQGAAPDPSQVIRT